MNKPVTTTPTVRERIVAVLRENREVRNIGALADELEAALPAQAQGAEPTIYVSRNCLNELLEAEGSHVALQTLIHRKPLRSGNGVPLYTAPPAPSVAVKALDDLTLPVAGTLFVARGAASARAYQEIVSDGDGYFNLVKIEDVSKALEPFRSALSAQVQDVAPKASPVEAFAEMLDALENARDLLEYGGFDLEKIDRAISNGRAIASAAVTPARQLTDLGQLEIRLQELIAEKLTLARLAAIDDHTRMWFVAELISQANGRIPLLEIEGLVSRHLATMEGGEA